MRQTVISTVDPSSESYSVLFPFILLIVFFEKRPNELNIFEMEVPILNGSFFFFRGSSSAYTSMSPCSIFSSLILRSSISDCCEAIMVSCDCTFCSISCFKTKNSAFNSSKVSGSTYYSDASSTILKLEFKKY